MYQVELSEDQGHLYRCTGCGSCQLIDTFPESRLDAFYETEYFSAKAFETRKSMVLARDYLKKVQDFIPSSGKVLEIGAGFGHFASLLARAHNQCVDVVEPSASCREFAQKNDLFGGRVTRSLADVSDRDYDIVLAFHVLEHLQRLRPFLNSIRSRMRVGGIAAFLTPNANSASFRQYGRSWGWACPNQHFQFLSELIPHSYFEGTGFRVVRLCSLRPAAVHFPSRVRAYAHSISMRPEYAVGPALLFRKILSAGSRLFAQNQRWHPLLSVERTLASGRVSEGRDELLLVLAASNSHNTPGADHEG